MKNFFAIFVSLISIGIFALAEESSPTAATSTRLNNGKFPDPHILSDSKLKADDGSLSRWSFRGTSEYNGPTFGNWSAPDVPNVTGKAGNYRQKISGVIGGRYRIDSVTTISLGTGIAINHPFHGWDRTDVTNPSLSYDMATRSGELQMRNSPGIVVTTVPDYTEVGEIGGLKWSNSMIYNVGTSRLALSLDNTAILWLFSRAAKPKDKPTDEYSFATYPGFKFYFSDAFNFNTSLGLSVSNSHQTTNKSTIANDIPNWRFGLSYAIDRDFYIAPYVQTYPDRMSADTTTFNLTTTINLL